MNRMCIITSTLLLIGTTAYGETIPEQIDINLQDTNPILASKWQDKKEVKGFNHLAHITTLEKTTENNEVCLICHKEAGTRAAIQDSSRKEKQQQIIITAGGIKKYMHSQCVTCHKTMKKQKETTGPTSCKGCH